MDQTGLQKVRWTNSIVGCVCHMDMCDMVIDMSLMIVIAIGSFMSLKAKRT